MINNEIDRFDVIILGSGLAGSILATILAKHNTRVLMLDKATHPRFAIGEALTSHTEKLFSLLSHQYSIPEFAHLSSFNNICTNITDSGCGYKRSFGFLYHREGKEQLSQERIQWGVTHSSHLFRQEIDHYLVKVAIKYGAKLLSGINVTDLSTDENKVEVEVNNGELLTANYLIDASGYSSLLAKKYNLREKPTRFKSQSRTIFTHMTGVKNTDDCLKDNHQNVVPWYKGTVHHVFDGGWMWIIPFNNHETSTNSISSVGLNLDVRRFPKYNSITPEVEWESIISRFPTIANQFENAKPIRKWISTGNLQYSSSSCVGERFYVLPHASGFIDPIFSVGLIQTLTIISPLAAIILEAVANNDFSTEKFSLLASLQEDTFDYNDNIANCTYISFQDFNLMNAWLRVWLLQHMMSVAKIILTRLQGFSLETYRKQNIKDWSRFTGIDYLQDIDPRIEKWGKKYVERAISEIEKVDKKLISPEQATKNITDLLNSSNWLFRTCGIANPSNRFVDLLTSKQFAISFIAYSFWSQIFLKKEARPYSFNIKDFIDVSRLGIEI